MIEALGAGSPTGTTIVCGPELDALGASRGGAAIATWAEDDQQRGVTALHAAVFD